MNSKINTINWQNWHFFVATAEAGSVSKASINLGVSQPTLSRQLVAMEKQLGQSLFNRSTQGINLTEFGSALLEEVRVMQKSAFRLQRLASGKADKVSGKLRLSVNEIIANYYLPNILPEFLDLYPDIFIEVEVTNKASNLDRRDADIAIRMFQPKQFDLVTRRLFNIPLGFYASHTYLDKFGCPESHEALFSHRVLGYDRDTQIEKGSQALGWDLKNEDFSFRCDFMPMHIELARKGGGIVVTHSKLAKTLSLKEIDIGVKLPDLPLYLVCHRDVQHNKKIRCLMDYLGQSLPNALK